MLMPSLLRPLAIGPKLETTFPCTGHANLDVRFFTVVVVVRVVFFLAAEGVFFLAELAFQEEVFDAVAAFHAVVGVVELLTTEPGITSLCPILRA